MTKLRLPMDIDRIPCYLGRSLF